MIHFSFDEKKATQAAAYILSVNDNKLDYMKLIKLLYLSDREAIAKWRGSITTDRYSSLPKGPITSQIYALIKADSCSPDDIWHTFIHRNDDYTVSLEGTPGFDELSPREMRAMKEINDRFKNVHVIKIFEYTHTLPEWKDPDGSSVSLPIEDILAAVVAPAELSDAIEEMNESAEVQKRQYLMRDRI